MNYLIKMANNWNDKKEILSKYILEDNLSYEDIGKIFDCTGANIKKVARKLGIELPQRRKVNPTETFNKEEYKCLNCNSDLVYGKKYCSLECQHQYEYNTYISDWKNGLKDGCKGKDDVSVYIRRYLFEKYNNSCQQCGWSKTNIHTKLVPLQIHHIDGDCTNNKENNLELLCPNCHALTENFGSRNKNATRIDKRIR